MLIAGGLTVLFVLLWAVVSLLRRGQLAAHHDVGARARFGLIEFSELTLDMHTAAEVLILAKDAANVIFGCERIVAFETGAEIASWEASVPGGEALPEVPAAMRGLFGWFKHNPAIAAEVDLAESRFGAMRGPIGQCMTRYGVDVLMPLVDRGEILAVIGVPLGRKPTRLDRDLMRLFRLQATAACANVRLHSEAAHVMSLAKEVDLAGAVELALVPAELEGAASGVSWAGHFQAGGDAGSDFWSVYPLTDGRLVFLIGDAVGAGLAGSMVSAVVKSCSDAIFDAAPSRMDPATLLGALNRALYRSRSPVHTSSFVVVIDPRARSLTYGNAGHSIPYHVTFGDETKLGVLVGAGPLLGDSAKVRYEQKQLSLEGDTAIVLFTDGLVKARNSEGKAYGERRMQKILKAMSAAPAASIRAAILTAIDEHRGSHPLEDDAALLVVRL